MEEYTGAAVSAEGKLKGTMYVMCASTMTLRLDIYLDIICHSIPLMVSAR